MKNKITLLNLLTFIFVLGLNGQDCTFKDVNFDYIQLPSKPVKKEYTNYQATVILKYIDDLNSSKGSYQERVKKQMTIMLEQWKIITYNQNLPTINTTLK